MALRFQIRSSDLKRLRNAIDANPCPNKGKHWLMYLEVSPSIAEFCFGGTRIQYPIDGKSVGYARFPDFAIQEATRWFIDRNPQAELEVSVGHGWLRCEEASSGDEIEVGYVRTSNGGRVLYTSDAELMALGEMVSDPALLHPDMSHHIKDARDSIMGSVYRTAADLRKRGVMQDEAEATASIQFLVHEKVNSLKPMLRERFGSLEIENLWKS